ncbi:ParB/RepB/Spo0J family partition protein [Nocardiopsis baichengensis]|uniref:ParB/RepB/Spo0J family partition protein n=1 Tax=Nocardiopsis baichengensis TaxID=280240 RepID=UPI00034A1C28|nr:ParB/RepB/Spo0J family partition protein [Nocardiopsis baichengensis]
MSKKKRRYAVPSTRSSTSEQAAEQVAEDSESLMEGAFQDRRQASVVPPVKRPLVELVGNPLNDRDDLGDIDTLAESIRDRGLRQPVTVMVREHFVDLYPDLEPKLGDASLVVVHGNRRLAAAEKIGLKEIEVFFARGPSDAGELRADVLIENLHRKNLEPLEEARAVQDLVRILGSNAAAARALNMSKVWVGQRLALLNLVPELQEALRGGELKIKEARRLGALPEQEQLAEWERGVNPVYPTPGSPSRPSSDGGVNPVHSDGAEGASSAGEQDGGERTGASPAPAAPAAGGSSGSAAVRPVQLTLSFEWSESSDGQSAAEEVAERIYQGLGQLGSAERDAVLDALKARR